MDNSSISKRKRTQRDYNLAFKLAVVEQVEKGEMTYKQNKEKQNKDTHGLFEIKLTFTQRQLFIAMAIVCRFGCESRNRVD